MGYYNGSKMISDLLAGQRDNLQYIIEANTTTGYTYIGYSPIGTKQSAAGWIIQRIYEHTVSNTTTTQRQWADLDYNTHSQIWDNRADYSYTIPT